MNTETKLNRKKSSLITNLRSLLWNLEHFHWIFLYRKEIASAAFPIHFWRSSQSNSPSPFQSDSSGCESPTYPGAPLYSRPETPATPLSPGCSLGGDFYIQLSSQTSDSASGTPKPTRRKRYIKKKTGSYKKGQKQPLRTSPVAESPLHKRHKKERPSREQFSDMRFTAPLGSYPIKLDSGDKTGVRVLVVPIGNAISNLEILSLLFGQLNCTE